MVNDLKINLPSSNTDHVVAFNQFFTTLLASYETDLYPGKGKITLHIPDHPFFSSNTSTILNALLSWQALACQRIIVGSGHNYSWEVLTLDDQDTVMGSLVRNTWHIPQFWVNDQLVGVRFSCDGSSEIKDDTVSAELINSIITLLTGSEVNPSVGEDMLREIQITRDDLQISLGKILSQIQKSQEAHVLEGRLISNDEMAAMAENCRVASYVDGILEFGVSKTAYQVSKDRALSTDENPEGFYIYDDHGSRHIKLTFPLKVTLPNHTSGYLLCSALIIKDEGSYIPGKVFDVGSELIKGFTFVSSVMFTRDIEASVSLIDKASKERLVVRQLVDALNYMYGLTPVLELPNGDIDYNYISNPYTAEDVEIEIKALLQNRQDPIFIGTSERIKEAICLASVKIAGDYCLLSFLSEYLTTKVLLEKVTLDDVLQKIAAGNLTWFSSLSSCISYLVREGGYRKILL